MNTWVNMKFDLGTRYNHKIRTPEEIVNLIGGFPRSKKCGQEDLSKSYLVGEEPGDGAVGPEALVVHVHAQSASKVCLKV